MALLWTKTVGNTVCEVRSAGSVRRLYTDGVLHSEYNPKRPMTGQVWDLLMLPAFFYEPGRLQRVLVLGVGGGTVIRQLRHFVRPRRIVGVELSQLHLEAAARFFHLEGPELELHRQDARHWLASYSGPPFDMIVDDLFCGLSRQPVRAVPMNPPWFRALLEHLSNHGLLVANFPSAKGLRHCGYCVDVPTRHSFQIGFGLTTPSDWNAIGAFLRRRSDTRTLRQRLKATPGLDPDVKANRVRYRVRVLKRGQRTGHATELNA